MRELAELVGRVAELERRMAGVMRHGTVHEVDPAKQIVRLRFGDGDDGTPFLSPWVPYAQIAGALKIHTPPSVGQQMTALSPAGDWRQAVAMPLTWSDGEPSPSDQGNEHILTFGNVRMELRNGQVRIQVGSTVLDLTAGKAVITADEIVTDGITHVGGEGGLPASREGTVDTGGFADNTNFATKVFLV